MRYTSFKERVGIPGNSAVGAASASLYRSTPLWQTEGVVFSYRWGG